VNDAVIVSTARTPIGKAFRGSLNHIKSPTLAAHAIRHALDRAAFEPGEVDDVILGAALPAGTAGMNLGRLSALAYNNWGDALANQRKYDEAITQYQKAAGLDPKSALAYNNWGDALANQRKYDEAITQYQKAADLDPKSALAYNNWGIALAKQHKYDEAITKYRKALDIDPTAAVVFENWSDALLKQGNYREAAKLMARNRELSSGK
jgi:tetratricopeptide (TPR) repeat protein